MARQVPFHASWILYIDIHCDVGVYQLWSLNNRGIGIDYLETIIDQKGNSVLLDVLEHCNVWWIPPFSNQDVSSRPNQASHALCAQIVECSLCPPIRHASSSV